MVYMDTANPFQYGQRVTLRRGKSCRWGRVDHVDGDWVWVTVDGKEGTTQAHWSRVDYGVPTGCHLAKGTP